MNKQQSVYILVTSVSALILITVGAVGLWYFSTYAWYMAYTGPKDPQSIPYNQKDVFALLLFSTTTPIGIVLILHVILTFLRALMPSKYDSSKSIRSLALFTLIIIATVSTFVAISTVAYNWSHHVLQYAFLFAYGSDLPTPDSIEPAIRAAGEGFRSTIAGPAIIICFALSISFLLLFFRAIFISCSQSWSHTLFLNQDLTQEQNVGQLNEKLLLGNITNRGNLNTNSVSSPSLIPSSLTPSTMISKSYTPYNTTFQVNSINGHVQTVLALHKSDSPIFLRFLIQIVSLFILLSSMYIVSSYIPNQFRSYWPSKAASFAALEVAHDVAGCSQRDEFTCPDIIGSTMHTTQYRLSEHVVLKFFPSNTIFFTFLAFALLFPFITRIFPTVDAFFSRKIVISVPSIFFLSKAHRKPISTTTKTYWSIYEILLIIWLMLGAYLFFHYCFFNRNWKQRQLTERPITLWDNMMRTSGQVAVFFLALCFFPVARSSPILSIIGIGWDKAINMHRWMGMLFLVMTVWHVIAAYGRALELQGWAGIIALLWPYPPIKAMENRDNFTVPLLQLITFFMFISIGVIAGVERIRRTWYNFFLIAHHITYIMLVPVVLWHAQASWEYLLPPLVFYSGDRLLRLYRGVQCVTLHPTFVNDLRPCEVTHSPIFSKINTIDLNLDYHDDDDVSVFSPLSINFHRILPKPITTIYAPKRHHIIPAPISSSNTSTSPTTPILAHNHNINPPGVRLLDYGAAGKYVELNIINAATDFVYFGGQFFFINIAEISLFEYHPMTTSSAIHSIKSNTISFLIKCVGKEGSWTNNLFKYIEDVTTKQFSSSQSNVQLHIPLTVSLDGPYGLPIDFNKYENVILCGAGSGITPIKSIYESLWLSFLHDYIPGQSNHTLQHQKVYRQVLYQLSKIKNQNHALTKNICENEIVARFDGDNDISLNDQHGTQLYNQVKTYCGHDDQLIHIPKRVHLFFAARDFSLFNTMSTSLANIPKDGTPFTAELIVSNNNKLIPPFQTDLGDAILTSLPSIAATSTNKYQPRNTLQYIKHHFSTQHLNQKNTQHGGQYLEESIKKAFQTEDLHELSAHNQRTIIFACGPQRLTDEAKDLAVKFNWEIHEEQFEL